MLPMIENTDLVCISVTHPLQRMAPLFPPAVLNSVLRIPCWIGTLKMSQLAPGSETKRAETMRELSREQS